MNTTNSSDLQNDQISEVLEKITEIVKKTKGENYIYRGESELYPQVCSNLYREYLGLDLRDPAAAVEASQKLIVRDARKFLSENNFFDTYLLSNRPDSDRRSNNHDRFEILAQLQHYGGRTNLIDFTTDYLIALYFACAHSDTKDGRVICLQITETGKDEFSWTDKNNKVHKVLKMYRTIRRAARQKSRFLESNNGIIEIGKVDTIIICKTLKKQLRDYLRIYHDISANNVYGDIQGFIQGLNIYPEGYKELLDGDAHKELGDLLEDPKLKKEAYDRAVEYYTQASKESKVCFEAYVRLGRLYAQRENFKAACRKYKKAIESDPDDATVYHALGNIYCQMSNPDYQKEEYDSADEHYNRAIKKYTQAINLDSDNAKYLISRGHVYNIQEKTDLAIEDYKQAMQLNAQRKQLNSDDLIMACRDLLLMLIKSNRIEEGNEILDPLKTEERNKILDSLKKAGVDENIIDRLRDSRNTQI